VLNQSLHKRARMCIGFITEKSSSSLIEKGSHGGSTVSSWHFRNLGTTRPHTRPHNPRQSGLPWSQVSDGGSAEVFVIDGSGTRFSQGLALAC
jgi:hypothetical protein